MPRGGLRDTSRGAERGREWRLGRAAPPRGRPAWHHASMAHAGRMRPTSITVGHGCTRRSAPRPPPTAMPLTWSGPDSAASRTCRRGYSLYTYGTGLKINLKHRRSAYFQKDRLYRHETQQLFATRAPRHARRAKSDPMPLTPDPLVYRTGTIFSNTLHPSRPHTLAAANQLPMVPCTRTALCVHRLSALAVESCATSPTPVHLAASTPRCGSQSDVIRDGLRLHLVMVA